MKLYIFLIFILSSIKLYSQEYKHEFNYWQKNESRIKEILIKKNYVFFAKQEFNSDGKNLFRKMNNSDSHFDYDVSCYVYDDEKYGEIIISGNSRARFVVLKIQENDFTKKIYVNRSEVEIKDFYKNLFRKEMKKIGSCEELLKNREVKRLLKQKATLMQIDYIDNNKKMIESKNFSNGNLIKIDSIKSESPYRNEPKYDENKNISELKTTKNNQVIFLTKFFYEDGKVSRREFDDFEKGEKIIYSFTYNDKGEYNTIEKKTGNKIDIFNFEYIYW